MDGRDWQGSWAGGGRSKASTRLPARLAVAISVVVLMSTLVAKVAAEETGGGKPARPPAATPHEAMSDLFGDEIKRVEATTDLKDDIALAGHMITAALVPEASDELVEVLTDKAYELAARHRTGYPTAIRAMQTLAKRVPDKRDAAFDRLATVYQRHFYTAPTDERPAIGKAFIDVLLTAAQASVRKRQYSDAQKQLATALVVAGRIRSDQAEAIREKQSHVLRLIRIEKRVALLQGKLNDNPSDRDLNKELFELCLVELNQPAEAYKYLELGGNPEAQQWLGLVVNEPANIKPEQLMGLGDWYRKLASSAPEASVEPLLRRAQRYYHRHLAIPSEDVFAHARAMLALKRINSILGIDDPIPSPASAPKTVARNEVHTVPEAIVTWAKERDKLSPVEQLAATLKKLRELNPETEITIRSHQVQGDVIISLDLSNNPALTNIDPLHGLPLRVLNLSGCKSVQSLAGLKGMPLTLLVIDNCQAVTSLEPLRGMKTLNHLSIRGCTGLRGDLSALTGIRCRRLEMDGCSNLTSLNGIESMQITWLSLANCRSLEGDLAPLAKLPLGQLDLLNCIRLKSLNGLQNAPLRSIRLINCKSLEGDLSMLKGKQITVMDLTGCEKLASLNGLQSMPLTHITLSGCNAIQSLDGLAGTKASHIAIEGGDALADVSMLKTLPVVHLVIRKCPKLELDMTMFRNSNTLHAIELSDVKSIDNLHVLATSTARHIDVSAATLPPAAHYVTLARTPHVRHVRSGNEEIDRAVGQILHAKRRTRKRDR